MATAEKRIAKIVIDLDRCKGCGLCVVACPKNLIKPTEELSSRGYMVFEFVDDGTCTGCTFCALMCPDVAIVVSR